MKRFNYFLLFACCILTLQAQAQFSFGIKGGHTRAWEHYGEIDLPEDAQIDINGFNLSLMTYWQIKDKMQIGVEPGLVRRGAACIPGWNVGSEPTFDNDTKWHLNYLELPVFVSFNVPLPFLENKLEAVGRIGYGMSYVLSGYQVFEIDNFPPFTESLRGVNVIDHGNYGGVGLKYNLGKHQIILETETYISFRDVSRTFTSKNRSVDISAGYLFTL